MLVLADSSTIARPELTKPVEHWFWHSIALFPDNTITASILHLLQKKQPLSYLSYWKLLKLLTMTMIVVLPPRPLSPEPGPVVTVPIANNKSDPENSKDSKDSQSNKADTE
ncbi:hypothetical protein NM208_g8022 [Fusarium decemcellulare]|uniref:Uncharacterized protein n=1 Tax=Fusarium decemcellulare TaxID=57161 RepID=A0ACC1S708_9HYPO|nr:hypothetical protein NM208_g8022 [Fusarium decemcellulare]